MCVLNISLSLQFIPSVAHLSRVIALIEDHLNMMLASVEHLNWFVLFVEHLNIIVPFAERVKIMVVSANT